MFLNEEQANARLNNERNLANRFRVNEQTNIVEEVIKRPGKNRTNLTVEERTEIAIRTNLGELGTAIAEEKGITPQVVSHIKNGRIQGVDTQAVDKAVAEVRDKALDRLMASLDLISNDKLSGCSAKDLSLIAANMGRVVDKTIPKSDSPDKIQLVIYTPELRQEKSFESVEV